MEVNGEIPDVGMEVGAGVVVTGAAGWFQRDLRCLLLGSLDMVIGIGSCSER